MGGGAMFGGKGMMGENAEIIGDIVREVYLTAKCIKEKMIHWR